MYLYMIGNKNDILIISGSKLDDTFPTFQFVLDNFAEHFRLDHTRITWRQHWQKVNSPMVSAN